MTAAPVFDKPAPTLQRAGADWERHAGHGGPKVLPPPGVEWRSPSGKTRQAHRYYTRVTTLAKAIDDTSKLMAWKMRGVLVGLGQRPDYVVAAAALTMDKRDRAAADELAEKALDASGPSAALVGTALHTWTERLDRGEPLGFVPPHLVPLVEAYRQLTAPLTFHHREVRMVCDDLETAGTPDAIGTCGIPDPDGVVDGLRIIDLKSGKVSYPGPMSIQLATYGRSDLYDPATGKRTPLEGVNQRWGLIVHTQQDGEVPPGLYWLNLQHGNEGIELCRLVRSWRKVKPQAILLPVAEVTAPDAVDELKVEDTVVVEQDPEPEQEPAAAERVVQVEAVVHPSGRVEVVSDPLPAGAIVCGEEPAQEDVQAVAAFAQFLETAGPPPTVLDAMTPEQRLEALGLRCPECTVDEDPAAWCDCRSGDDPCVPPCKQRAHVPDECPTLPQEDDEAAQDGTDETADPSWWDGPRRAIAAAVTTRDLTVLWQQDGGEWPAELVELATERHRELKAQEDLEKPRAALSAAISTATEQELHQLWMQYGQTPVWTEAHAQMARHRYDQLLTAGAA